MKKHIYILFLFVMVVLVPACREPGDVVRKSIETAEVDEQKLIGDKVYEHILGDEVNFPLLKEENYPSAYIYLNSLLKTLLQTSIVERRNDFEWTVDIIEQDDYESMFSTPGGHIFITTGFLRFILAENELLSALAHEMYYSDTDANVKNLIGNIDDGGLVLGDIILGYDIEEMDEVANALKSMVYSKADIEMADNYSIDLMCPFLYNSEGIKAIIERMFVSTAHIEWFDSRPIHETRVKNIIEMSERCGEQEPTFEERYQEFVRTHLP